MVRLFAATILWIGAVNAQERPTLQVLVEEPDEDARACGINKSTLESLAFLTLRNNGVQPIDQYGEVYLYIAVTVIRLGTELCIASDKAEVFTFVPLSESSAGGFKGRRRAEKQLCNSSGVISGRRGTFTTELSNSVEQRIKVCLGKLEY